MLVCEQGPLQDDHWVGIGKGKGEKQGEKKNNGLVPCECL